MIYTVTLNPSIDYTADVGTAELGKTNRTKNEYIAPGGKGLNSSIILSRLGQKNIAFGFTAGFTGLELERIMKNHGTKCRFTKIENGLTRINVKFVADEVTEFNGSGISVSDFDIHKLCKNISRLKSGDWLVLSGSAPRGANPDIYKTLMSAAKDGVKIVLDTVGEPLKLALPQKPFLVKPNLDELCDFFETPIETDEQIVSYAKKLSKMGAKNVLVSLGEKGAILLSENGDTIKCDVPKGEMLNTVGAGDSMVAGFIHKFKINGDYNDALKFAVAAGSATAYSKWLAEKDLIEKLYTQIK